MMNGISLLVPACRHTFYQTLKKLKKNIVHKLDSEKLTNTLSKLHKILEESGFPKGSVTISFNGTEADESLVQLRAQNPKEDVIVISDWECHWGGCHGQSGIACCTF